MERERDDDYRYYRVKEDPAHPTLLHLAVERNFLHVAKLLVEKHPSLVYTRTRQVGERNKCLPVEKALLSHNDETAAYLILQMGPDRWITKLYIFTVKRWILAQM